MKELGEYLKEIRTKNGVSIDEAAQDLNIDVFLLESIEKGNTRAFKDVLSMKDKVKEYAKYLGLKPEDVIDEFNDYLFEKTSKISLKDIMDAEKELNKKDTKKVSSPYTIIKPKKKRNIKIRYFLIPIILMIVLVLLLFYFLRPKKNKPVVELKSKTITIIEGDYYEFAQ